MARRRGSCWLRWSVSHDRRAYHLNWTDGILTGDQKMIDLVQHEAWALGLQIVKMPGMPSTYREKNHLASPYSIQELVRQCVDKVLSTEGNVPPPDDDDSEGVIP